MRINSIYRQLLTNIVIPVIIGLLIIGIFSYRNTKTILRLHNETERNFIYDEIKSFIELQFVALGIIEDPMDILMREYSAKMVDEYFINTFNIENIDLNTIRKKLRMDVENIDLYVINRDGIVVNTTFREDLYINFFSFGEAHKQYLIDVFNNGKFDSPKFFFEHKTKRYKKYSYHPTKDGKYIIEIGLYSTQADKIYDYMISHLDEIPLKKPNLVSVDLFRQAAGKPYPLNLRREFIPEHLSVIPELIEGKVVTRAFEKDDKNFINYTYFYLADSNAKIFDGNIIRIANDTSSQLKFIKKEKIKISIILLISLSLVYLLIYFRSRMIVDPIKHLIEKTKVIANGKYSERVMVAGNNELSLLSANFNKMVNNIEERNNQIEEQSEFLYQSNRKLNEAYKLLDHQKSLIENKQDDLTASINYAQRIQDSLLPETDGFKTVFDESFVYYLPRDIVSGDFYWFSKTKNKAIIVASDCTGHGVPGAFMSMIGMTILNHLVKYEHIDDPALIISRLDAEICDLLIYNNKKQQRFEGMDAAVCCIDFDSNEMKFASAQRPIILMRNGEAFTYKGSIYPIGEYYDNIQKIFTNTVIPLEDNDVFYMFSDGYTSQFEESGTKKFNYRRFRKLLTDINHRPLKDQPAILHRTLEAWQGTGEQIDDIMVIGFKYKTEKVHKKFSARDLLDG
ncbi:MAG: SpoIIE family protein phosphatase [Salinivirgaceae bacterium]|nr:SpoIIE family protein phosphatase [Salinivirgaceae bacterium]